jgi:hypothetical protein
MKVLETFYNRMMPLYPPQAERFIERASPEVFNEVAFRYTFSVEAMTTVSRIIENSVIDTPGSLDFYVSFQEISRVLPQQSRYRRLVDYARNTWLYGRDDVPSEQLSFLKNATIIDTSGTALTNYWFVVSYGPGVGMTLLAEEVSALSGNDRYYEGFYTFEIDVAYQMAAILHHIYPEAVPTPTAPELMEL